MSNVKKENKTLCRACRHLYDNSTAAKHFCVYCNECLRLCACRKRAGIGTFKVPRANAAGIGNSSMFVNSPRAIGLELELSNFGSWAVEEKMKAKLPGGFAYNIDHDGSVKPSMKEAVFAPLAGDQQVIQGLNAIAQQVWDHNCEVNETCGYHVHVDARDFSWIDIQKLLIAWVSLENNKNLWKLAGRGPTTFSETWLSWLEKRDMAKFSTDLKTFKSEVIKLLYNTDTSSYKEHLASIAKSERYLKHYNDVVTHNQLTTKANHIKLPKVAEYLTSLIEHKRMKANRGWNRAVRSRYLDLNIHSWLFRGTVEYRLAAGTVDANDIRMWPLFCLWFTEAISRTSLNIIRRHTLQREDLINLIIRCKGFPIPSFLGEKIYPIAPFLHDWLVQKVK